MKRIRPLFLPMLVLWCTISKAQNPTLNASKTDSVFSMAKQFKRCKIPLGTDTLYEFSEANGERKLNAKNIRTIEKVTFDKVKYYLVTTQNIPAKTGDITTEVALLDYDDLHLLKMRLDAKSDSGFVEFKQHRFSGWSQLPKEERKTIDLPYAGLTVLADAGTPWMLGLRSLAANDRIALPYFALFTNIVKWKTYTVLGKEEVVVNGKKHTCWKVNAGPVGPPGYTSYQWYDAKTGRFIKSELVKEGAAIKFVSELMAGK